METRGRTLAELLFILGSVVVNGYRYQDHSSGAEIVLLQPGQPRVISLVPNARLSIQPGSSAGYDDVGFVVMQIHTQLANVTVSLSPSFVAASSQNGTGLGVVIPVQQQQGRGVDQPSSAVAYVWNFHYQPIEAVVLASLYTSHTPIPGGCNEEFIFEDDANIHLSFVTQNPLVSMLFQYADLPLSTGALPGQPDRCDDKSSWPLLLYDIYIYYLPERSLLESDYMQSVQKFMTVSDVISHGQLVLTIYRGQSSVKPRFSLMADVGQGFLMNIVVRMANDSRVAASYIPAVSYNCDVTLAGDCLGSGFGIKTAVECLTLLAGLILCFAGHRLFKFEIFLVGFLVILLPAYVAVAKISILPLWGQLSVTFICGIVGGCSWLALWLCLGRAHLSMLPAFAVFGYVIAMAIFISPFGALQVLHYDVAYWPVFGGYVLFMPLVAAFCIKRWAQFNLVMCAVIGSYCSVSALSSFIGAAVHRWALLPALRATVPGYSEALMVFPYQLKDLLLSAAWVVLAAAGVGVQFYRERPHPSMPVLPSSPANRRLSVRQPTRSRVNPDLFTDERQRLLDSEEPRGPLPQPLPSAYGSVVVDRQLQRQPQRRPEVLTDGLRPHSPPPAYGAAA